MLTVFKKFIKDPNGWEMFISGEAGTGKTTGTAKLVQHCIDNGIDYVVCAHTHKACGILRDKLPEGANISTTHSFLSKRPTVNDSATHIKNLQKSRQFGDGGSAAILMIDEYSQVGDSDYGDIGLLQDPDGKGEPAMKVVYIGDPNQLPPIVDVPAVNPGGDYNYVLTKVWRQAGDNKLLDTLHSLVEMIQGGPPTPLRQNANFLRDKNIVNVYNNIELTTDKVILAYTNERVESLNAELAGKDDAELGDIVFSPTVRELYSYRGRLLETNINEIARPYGDDLKLGSKFKSLEHLIRMDCCEFTALEDEEQEQYTFATVFGHYQYKLAMQKYGEAAVMANLAITQETGEIANVWAKRNKSHPMARVRAKAWRDYLTFKDCVICIDFPYAMTVHKSQGSTFKYVLIDTEDLSKCRTSNYKLYLKLLYVAISRASDTVFTN